MSSLNLVCGYRRTGKDTLASQFNSKDQNTVFNWVPLYHASRPKDETFHLEPVKQVSFAAALKAEVLEILDLPPNFDMEPHKDTLIVRGKTLRQHLINQGAARREENQDYWCAAAYKKVNLVQQSVMVTDWRFYNEFLYSRVLCGETRCILKTIRVFRKDVPIPPNIPSERSLDTVATDYVLIPKLDFDEEFEALVQHFPQYKSYVPAKVSFST